MYNSRTNLMKKIHDYLDTKNVNYKRPNNSIVFHFESLLQAFLICFTSFRSP